MVQQQGPLDPAARPAPPLLRRHHAHPRVRRVFIPRYTPNSQMHKTQTQTLMKVTTSTKTRNETLPLVWERERRKPERFSPAHKCFSSNQPLI